MIEVYTWPTPNGHKIHIMLEECGLEHEIHPVDIQKGEQFEHDFLAISPNNRIPAIIDNDGPGSTPFALFESGAILIYLAEKTGKFLSRDKRQSHTTIQWLMFQMAGVGPNLGQTHHFRRAAPEKVPYAIERFTNETRRLWGVMDKRLEDRDWLAADEFSIADIAVFPWAMRHEWQGISLDEFPNMKRWYEIVESRPGVKRGLAAQVPGWV